MRKRMALLLAMCCLSGVLGGCSNDRVLSKTEYYSLVREGGEHYLQFHEDMVDDGEKYAAPDWPVPVEYPHFPTVGEMRQGILSGEIKGDFDTAEHSYSYLAWIERDKDENGRVKTFDPDELYELRVPEDVTIKQVVWRGGFYTFRISSNGSVNNAAPCDEAVCRREYERLCGLRPMPDRHEPSGENHLSLWYNMGCGEDALRREYQIGEGDKTRHIVEIYPSQQDTLPKTVVIFGRENGSCFYAVVRPAVRFKERPTEEWLLSFGLDKWSPNG